MNSIRAPGDDDCSGGVVTYSAGMRLEKINVDESPTVCLTSALHTTHHVGSEECSPGCRKTRACRRVSKQHG